MTVSYLSEFDLVVTPGLVTVRKREEPPRGAGAGGGGVCGDAVGIDENIRGCESLCELRRVEVTEGHANHHLAAQKGKPIGRIAAVDEDVLIRLHDVKVVDPLVTELLDGANMRRVTGDETEALDDGAGRIITWKVVTWKVVTWKVVTWKVVGHLVVRCDQKRS